MTRKRKGNLPPATPEEARRIADLFDKVTVAYSGQVDALEQAIGMYWVGRHTGWKALVLMHNKRTLRNYEQILGISIREEFPEVGPDAERSMAYRIASKMSNFWKAVSGDEKITDRKLIV